MKTGFVVVAALLASAGLAQAAVVYTNTTQTGSRYNPGADTLGTPNITVDDVPLAASLTGGATHIEITKVTVGLRRNGSLSPAQQLNFYSTTFTGVAINSPTLLGGLSVAAGTGAAFFTDVLTLGDGVGVLATVPLDYGLAAGFGTFGVGISMSDTSANTGWRVTNGPDANINNFWLWNPDAGSQFGPLVFSGGVTLATMYLVVEGNFVPTPATAMLLSMGGLVALRRRR